MSEIKFNARKKARLPKTEGHCPFRAKLVDEITARLDLAISSAAERPAVNREVGGSNPSSPAILAQPSDREGAVRGSRGAKSYLLPDSQPSGVARPHNSDSNGALGANILNGKCSA